MCLKKLISIFGVIMDAINSVSDIAGNSDQSKPRIHVQPKQQRESKAKQPKKSRRTK